MALLPYPFLFRVAYRCPFIKNIPQAENDELLDLPEACRIDRPLTLEGQRDFADVRLAWNEKGLGVQVAVKGKDEPPQAMKGWEAPPGNLGDKQPREYPRNS